VVYGGAPDFAMYAFSNLAHHHLLKGRSEMPMFQARIIRQEVAITEVEGDTLETAKEKAESVLENGDNLKS
jgi:hypothetical protein